MNRAPHLPYLICLFFAAVLWAMPTLASAQPKVTTPFANKRVAIYLSKKNLTYNSDFQLFMGGFLLGDDSLNLSDESFKLALSIKLGDYWAQTFNQQLGANGCLFVNADPGLGAAFVNNTSSNGLNINNLRPILLDRQIDYVWVIDELQLNTELRKSVYTISNQIITEHRKVKVASISYQLYNVATNQMTANVQSVYDPDKHKTLPPYLVATGPSNAERYLVQLSNFCLRDMFSSEP